MNNNNFFFTIAIPTFNRKDILEKNLELIFSSIKNTPDKIEILVIDDCSTDQTKKLLEDYKKIYKEKFNFFISEKNNGIAKTRNLLVEKSQGNYIIFIDSDVFVTKETIKAHIDFHKKYNNYICQGNLNFISNLNDLNKIKKSILTDYSNSFFDTANLSIKKELIVKVGLFDENFTGYGWEDLELGIRLKKIGIKSKKNKKALAYHYHNETFKDLNLLIEKEKQRAIGGKYFLKKHNMLEVKLMVQDTYIHKLVNTLINYIFNFDKPSFLEKLMILEKINITKFNFLLKIYLNHITIKELENNKK
ncbi:MAG: glycosyltransferase [Candidatus Sericytochromatia bacterium]